MTPHWIGFLIAGGLVLFGLLYHGIDWSRSTRAARRATPETNAEPYAHAQPERSD